MVFQDQINGTLLQVDCVESHLNVDTSTYEGNFAFAELEFDQKKSGRKGKQGNVRLNLSTLALLAVDDDSWSKTSCGTVDFLLS